LAQDANTRANTAAQQRTDALALKTKQQQALKDTIANTPKSTADVTLANQINAAYEANPEQFTKAYGNDLTGSDLKRYNADPSNFDKTISNGKMNQSDASKKLMNDSLQAGLGTNRITDPKDYERRYTQDAIAKGADPLQAAQMAKVLAAQADTPRVAKVNKDAAKAQYKVDSDVIKGRLTTLDKMYGKNKKSGGSGSGGRTFSNDPTGWANMVNDLHTKFPNTDWGSGAVGGDDLTNMLNKLAATGKYNPKDVHAAALLASEGTDGAWFDKDREVVLNKFNDTLAKFTNDRKKGKPSADKALDDTYAAKRDALLKQQEISGKNYVNQLSAVPRALTDRESAQQTISDFYGLAGNGSGVDNLAPRHPGSKKPDVKPPEVPGETTGSTGDVSKQPPEVVTAPVITPNNLNGYGGTNIRKAASGFFSGLLNTDAHKNAQIAPDALSRMSVNSLSILGYSGLHQLLQRDDLSKGTKDKIEKAISKLQK